jgi:hopanoid biosynthesis associated RND transporter like protein HpnN
MNFEAPLSGLLSRWVYCVRENAALTIAVCAIVTVVSVTASALWLGMNSNTMELFPEELSARRNHDAFVALFPDLENALLIVVDAETPEAARTSAERLSASLRADVANFEDVYEPGGGAFFERNALLYQSAEDLEEFGERLLEFQPIVGELERDGSIANLAALIRHGLDRILSEERTAGEREAVLWSDILERVGRASVEVYQEHPVAVSWEALMLRGSAIEVVTRRIVLAHPVLDFAAPLPAAASLAAIRASAKELGLSPERGVRVRVTGNPALLDEETRSLVWDIGVSGLLCLVLVTAILLVALRSGRLALAVVMTLITGLLWTAGFAAVAVGDLNVISVAAGVLFLGLGVDFGIHFAMRYADLIRAGSEPGRALDDATRSVGAPLVLCTATTTIGFFAFLPTDYRGVAELGLITGVGLVIILFLTLTLLPALLAAVFEVDARRLSAGSLTFGDKPAALVARFAPAIRWTAFAAALAAVWLVPSLRFDANIVSMRDPSTESVQTFNDLLADADRASPWYANSVAPTLAEADAVKREMRALGVASRSITLSDYIPENQSEKLEILADLAMMMDSGGHATASGQGARLPVPDQIAALRGLRDVLEDAAPTSDSSMLRASILDLQSKLDDFLARVDRSEDPARSLALLEDVLLASLPVQIERLHEVLQASSIGVADLPPRLVSRLLSPDGRARVQTFPSENLEDHAAFTHFVEAVQSVDANATGVAVNLVEFARTTQRAFRQALATAVVVVAAMLFFLWRRVVDVLLVLAPLFLAAVLTAAWMVLAELPLSFFNVVVIPLLLGAGVDSGIHLVGQARRGHTNRVDILGTTTARAVFFSALTTITSFGTLAFSSHVGLAGLGALLAFGMSLTVLCNLVVLPALLAWHPSARVARPLPADAREV